eukprot:599007-Prymnesium_polylepis.1
MARVAPPPTEGARKSDSALSDWSTRVWARRAPVGSGPYRVPRAALSSHRSRARRRAVSARLSGFICTRYGTRYYLVHAWLDPLQLALGKTGTLRCRVYSTCTCSGPTGGRRVT